MTDKEQIIIDGVNVSECHFAILPKDSCPAKSRPYARETSCSACKEHNTILNYCKNNPNCYYKQLAHKTQIIDEVEEVIKPYQEQIELDALSLPIAIESILERKEQECEIWKNQVLILDDEAVTVQVTQEQFEEYQKLKQECEELKIKLIQKDEVNMFFNTPIEGWDNDPCKICESKNNYEQLKEDYAELEQECEKRSILAQEESARNGYIEYELNDKLKQKTQEYENLKAEEKYLKQCCQKAGEELAKHSFEYDGKEKNLIVQAMELNEKYEKLSILAQEESARNGMIEYELNDKLKQKTQECEKLKEENKVLQKLVSELEYSVQVGVELNDRYCKALEEIEEVLKDEICEECPGEEGCKGGCKEHQCLNIINKVKVEGTENE